MQFDADRQEPSAGGTVSLYANDEKIGEGRMERTVGFRFSGFAGMDVGRDRRPARRPRLCGQSPLPFHRDREEGRSTSSRATTTRRRYMRRERR